MQCVRAAEYTTSMITNHQQKSKAAQLINQGEASAGDEQWRDIQAELAHELMRLVLRHNLGAFEIEAEAHFLESFFAHGMSQFLFISGIKH